MGHTLIKYLNCCKNSDNLNSEMNTSMTNLFKLLMYKDILEILSEGNDLLFIKSFKFTKNKYSVFHQNCENNQIIDKLIYHFDCKNSFNSIDFIIFIFPITNHLENKEEDLIRLIKNFCLLNNEKVTFYDLIEISIVDLNRFFRLYVYYQTKFIIWLIEDLIVTFKEKVNLKEKYSDTKINEYADNICLQISDYSHSKKQNNVLTIKFEIILKWTKKYFNLFDDMSLRLDYDKYFKENII